MWLIRLSSIVVVLAAVGCNQSAGDAPSAKKAADKEKNGAAVVVVRPKKAPLHRKVRQPGTVQPFERTAIFAKVAGYVRKWHVDKGDRVKKGQILVELSVPELEVELKQRQALVVQADAEVRLAREAVKVAGSEQQRLKSQSERLARVGRGGLLDQENVEESRMGYESARARWEQARAAVDVKEAALNVAKQNRDYTAAMLGYTRLTAPYDGVVTKINVSTGDLVQPASGTSATPLYVVERRDRMRVFVDVPEADADWIHVQSEKDAGRTQPQTRADIHVPALWGRVYTDQPVVRTSFALDRMAHTLVAEVNLENPDDRLRPNLYVYSTLTAVHPPVLSVPASAILTQGDVLQGYRTYCFMVEGGKARRVPVQVGIRGDNRVQVLKKQFKPADSRAKPTWQDFTGKERIVQGKLAKLTDGQAVRVVREEE
jgi:multidrug efflux pump subunit AcrA (membrane-fusion protein)